jgi:hypothetical protein
VGCSCLAGVLSGFSFLRDRLPTTRKPGPVSPSERLRSDRDADARSCRLLFEVDTEPASEPAMEPEPRNHGNPTSDPISRDHGRESTRCAFPTKACLRTDLVPTYSPLYLPTYECYQVVRRYAHVFHVPRRNMLVGVGSGFLEHFRPGLCHPGAKHLMTVLAKFMISGMRV